MSQAWAHTDWPISYPGTTNGTLCPQCGNWHQLFVAHVCLGIRVQPYTCPNCNGYGVRPKTQDTTVPESESCVSCNGSGVLWR